MSTYSISSSVILNEAKLNPKAEESLRRLFPDAFQDNSIFCRIGTLLVRKGYLNNLYALIKENGIIRLITINGSHFWKSVTPLRVSNLRYPDFLTKSEFCSLMGSYANEFSTVKLSNVTINTLDESRIILIP